MIPRTVQMAAEVAAQFTTSQLDDYGNIVLNGYSDVVPNTINKKAWQYKETSTAPVNLPGLPQVQPAMKGWTTNYQEYYTKLQPNGYGVNPGDPTMFEYTVHSFTPQTGAIDVTGWMSPGSGYTPGTYNAEFLSGDGVGATANIVVTADPLLNYGPATTASFVSAGSGYPSANQFFVSRSTYTLTGNGNGLTVSGNSNNGVLISITAVDNGGSDYRVGDTFSVNPGTGEGRVDAIGPNGVVTSFTIVNPGTGYTVGSALTAPGLPGGSGFSILVYGIVPTPGTGGEPKWSQAPRRLINGIIAPYVPPTANQQAIAYSAILYPVADNPVEPPIGEL